jgi:NADPH:quinone reductase-like Zn-dependent oxidoreductase
VKAIAFVEYGSADRLRFVEIEKPVPKEGEILIRVRAASVNAMDYHRLRGKPSFIRVFTGLRRPKREQFGFDVAGEVEAVGENVATIKEGDAVFGVARGSFAEYACAPMSKVVIKSESVSFQQGAALPVAGLTALQGLRDKGKVTPGMKVLVNGAGGGVGTFAVQIAKASGAEVTAVTTTSKIEMVRSLGADHIIDHTRDDFTTREAQYDVIFDLAANHSFASLRRVMSKRGAWLVAGGATGQGVMKPLSNILKGFSQAPFVRQNASIVSARLRAADLSILQKLVEEGKITPMIGATYPLNEGAQAVADAVRGNRGGKIVINVP